jgi:hypothetical protein
MMHVRAANLIEQVVDVLPSGLKVLHGFDADAITVELVLFPYVYTMGTRTFAGKGSLADCMRCCMRALLSPFTLHAPYLLPMFKWVTCLPCCRTGHCHHIPVII